ncbi:hypothetical protein D3C72_2349000 [compost metagenome]
MRLGTAGPPLLDECGIQPCGQLGKTLQSQTAADGEKTVMKILAVFLPARVFAKSRSKVVPHALEILLAQTLKTHLERIFHHRNH